MKKFFLLSLACVLSLSLLGCEDAKSTMPQPTAGNEPPKYLATKDGPLGKRGGTAGPATKKTMDAKTTIDP
jgi:hypothetical protein